MATHMEAGVTVILTEVMVILTEVMVILTEVTVILTEVTAIHMEVKVKVVMRMENLPIILTCKVCVVSLYRDWIPSRFYAVI